MWTFSSGVLWILHIIHCAGGVEITHPGSYQLNVHAGSSISVECVSQDGSPLQWLHKGRRINQNSRYTVGLIPHRRHSHRKSILTLSDVTEEDSGRITCMDASNHAHTDDVMLHVNQVQNIPVVEIVEPATKSTSVVAGSFVMFKCINRDGKKLEWFFNGMPLHSGTHIITEVSLDGTNINLLSPRHVNKADEGRYTCQEVGNHNLSDSIQVKVDEPSHGTAHIDIVEPSTSVLRVREGTPLQLKCTADIDTPVGWLKNNVPLQNGVDGYIITEGTESSFKTSVLSSQDAIMEEANYTCINKGDHSESDQVKVVYGDSFNTEYKPPQQEHRVVIRMQSSVSLQCLINARGNYDVSWSREAGSVEASDKYSINRAVDINTLTIRNTDQHDLGQYQCSFVDKETGKTAGLVIYNVSGLSCPPIHIPTNGIALNCPHDAYVGDTCTIQCNSHSSNMVGTTVAVCEMDERTNHAYWTDTGVHCTVPIPRDEEDPIPSSLSHVLLRAHESTRLQCAETGHWMRGNHTLKSGNKYHIINSTLVIRNTGKEDSGEYTCVLYDNKGFLYGFKKFNVTYMNCRPLKLPKHVYVSDCSRSPIYGETCRFQCEEGYQMEGSPFSTCELLTPSETGTYWTSEPPQCSSRGHKGEHFGQESQGHSDLHLKRLCHVITLVFIQMLHFTVLCYNT